MLPFLSALLVVLALGVIGKAFYTTYSSRRLSQMEFTCRQAMHRKAWPQLEQSARKLLTWKPDSGAGWLYLGEAAQRQGDFELTAQCLANVPDEDPRCVPALAELLELQMAKLKRPLDAVKTCQRILRLQPQHAVAHQRLVFIYALTLQRREMIHQIEAAANAGCLTSDMLIYRATAASLRFSNGVAINHEWLQASPGEELFEVSRAYHVAKLAGATAVGEIQFVAGDMRLMEECRRKYPTNLEVLAFYLEKAAEEGNVDRTVELLEMGPPQAEEDSRFWRAKGYLHSTREELDLAAEAFRRAVETDPFDWRSRHQYASVLRRQGQSEEVDRQTKIAFEGKMLERELMSLPNASELPPHLSALLVEFCEQIGEQELAARIRQNFGWKGLPAPSL